MNRTIQRLVATGTTALLLAATVGAGAVLAAPASSDPTPAAPAAPAARAGADRCAAQWDAARDEPTVENLQAVGRCEIDRRLETLEKLQKAVDASRALTDAHETSLEGILASTTDGVTALRAEIDAATTEEALRGEIRRIFEDFRVYALVARQVWLVTADDTVVAAAARLTDVAGRLEAAIDAAEAAGRDVGDARSHLAAMTAAISAAQAAVGGDAAAVLALTPAGWNAGDAKPVLDAARSSITEARSSLRTAVREARAGFRDLR